MPEQTEGADPVTEHVRSAEGGLRSMLQEAQATWDARADQLDKSVVRPGWRAFEDAFPTFYQFTNRPR
jgi:hypothetical protein